jgi:hypothetical protein
MGGPRDRSTGGDAMMLVLFAANLLLLAYWFAVRLRRH